MLQPIGHRLQLGRGAPEATYRFAVPCRRHGHVVGFVADINAGGIRVNHVQADVFALDLPRHLAPLLAVHLLPVALRWAAGCVLGFLLLLVFHANRSTLNSTWLGPVSETYSISPAGSGPYPFQDNAATIYTIATYRSQAPLSGRHAPGKNSALAAEP